MGIFQKLFSFLTPSYDEAKALLEQEDVLIVDVRTPGEYASGHAEDSINIPLSELGSQVKHLQKKGLPLVLCCRSGNRSGQGVQMLQSKGITCENGGSWQNVNRLLQEIG